MNHNIRVSQDTWKALKIMQNHSKPMRMTYYCDYVGDTCRTSHVYTSIHVSNAFYLLMQCFSFVFSVFIVCLCHSQPSDGPHHPTVSGYLKSTQNHAKSLKINENDILLWFCWRHVSPIACISYHSCFWCFLLVNSLFFIRIQLFYSVFVSFSALWWTTQPEYPRTFENHSKSCKITQNNWKSHIIMIMLTTCGIHGMYSLAFMFLNTNRNQ